MHFIGHPTSISLAISREYHSFQSEAISRVYQRYESEVGGRGGPVGLASDQGNLANHTLRSAADFASVAAAAAATAAVAVAEHRIFIHNYTAISQDINFTSEYRHISVNSYEYEFLCFDRWHVIAQIVHHSGMVMDNIVVMDADVMILVDLPTWFMNSTQSSDLSIHALGGLTFFKAVALQEYSAFIHRFYQLPEDKMREVFVNRADQQSNSFQ